MSFNKAIDNLNIKDATAILTVIMLQSANGLSDTQIKTKVREHLRTVKLSPADALLQHCKRNDYAKKQRRLPVTEGELVMSKDTNVVTFNERKGGPIRMYTPHQQPVDEYGHMPAVDPTPKHSGSIDLRKEIRKQPK